MESGPVPATASVYTASDVGHYPSRPPRKGHSAMAQDIRVGLNSCRQPRPLSWMGPLQGDPTGLNSLRNEAECPGCPDRGGWRDWPAGSGGEIAPGNDHSVQRTEAK